MIQFVKAKFLAAKKFFTRKQEEGAALVEYGLLIALIALACIIALTTLGGNLSNMFRNVAGQIRTVNTNAR